MMKFTNRRVAALLVAAGVSWSCVLQGQTVQSLAKVSASLPKYLVATPIKSVVEVPGTDALTDLGDEWNRGFKKFHPEARIQFKAKLTKDVVQGLINGTSILAITARELTPEELRNFQAKFGYQPMRIPVCLDANIVFVHKDNPITSITMEQLDAIYSKSRLGGAKAPAVRWGDLGVRGDLAKRTINAYSRAEGAATRQSFANMVMLKGEFRPGIIDREDTQSLAESILTDPAGIAFSTLTGWYAANKVLPVVPYQGTEPRFPNQDNVTSSRYPMPRLFYAYVNRTPGKPLDPGVNEVLHYILASEGQNDVANVGLLPGPVEFISIALKRLAR